jgi:hypothetical protein
MARNTTSETGPASKFLRRNPENMSPILKSRKGKRELKTFSKTLYAA